MELYLAASWLCGHVFWQCYFRQHRVLSVHFIWLMWCILTRIGGWLWLDDFTTTLPNLPYNSNTIALGILLADLVIVISAIFASKIIRILLVLLTLLTESSVNIYIQRILFVVITGLLIFILKEKKLATNISGVLLNLFVVIALAWACYRIGEWDESLLRMRGRRVVISVMILLLFLIVALLVKHDFGPLQVVFLGFMWLLSIVGYLVLIKLKINGKVATMISVISLVFSVVLLNFLVINVAPIISDKAKNRVQEFLVPDKAPTSDTATMLWLIGSTPDTGYGLGKTPWCGIAAAIGNRKCTTSAGVVNELSEDNSFAGVIAVWGKIVALMFLCLLINFYAYLLKGILVSAVQVERLFARWLIALAIIFQLAHSFIVISIGLHAYPITGIGLPIFSFGRAMLCYTAFWVGLAIYYRMLNLQKKEQSC